MFFLRWLRRKVPAGPRRIDLALQGGGSHGAFTWGVLDRLLQDERLEISGISGTSAGAMNAAVLATGFARGGRSGAREALRAFWVDISDAGRSFTPFTPGSLLPPGTGFDASKVPAWQWLASLFKAFSPYEFNPLNVNPLREVAARHLDEAALRGGPIPLFITATSVRTGHARVFSNDELSVDAVMASACLPFLFHAVEIDGEPYWDGGYAGNPALHPLIYRTGALDVLLVKLDPLRRDQTPRRVVEIVDRVNEITFNAALLAEMRAIAFVSRLVREKRLDRGRYKDLRLHMIADDDALAPFAGATKLNTDRAFLERLHRLGFAAADRWLAQHAGDIGVRSSFDVEREFLAPAPSLRPAAIPR